MYNRLYIHVPFCVRKCNYCAFVSAYPRDNELSEYPGLLTRELQLHPTGPEPIASIYFGGGTPSLLQPGHIAKILAAIADKAGITTDAEITLEINPGTVDDVSLKEFRAAGINRVSLGVQSFNDTVLKRLGRIHTAEQSREAYRQAREAGFNTISIDLIHSLPGQSLEQWQSELQQAVALNPEHISIYGLTVEEGTPFARTYPEDSPELADEDLSADMVEYTHLFLTESAFEQYEIANYARSGYRSQHNSGYWRRDGYLGLGVAAHSFFRKEYGVRFSNPATLEEYRRQVLSGKLARKDEQWLTQSDAMAEYMFLGLRLADGISRSAFEREFGRSLEDAFGSVTADLVILDLLIQHGDLLALTQRGILLSNQVFNRFL